MRAAAAAGLGLCLLFGAVGAIEARGDDPAAPAPTPAATLELWPGEAPGDAGATIPPESAETKGGIKRVSNVSRPSIAVFRPDPAKNTGAAVVICPGGGYSILAIDHEGDQVARFLAERGVTGVVLKYRIPRRKGTANDVPPPQALMDAQRAIGLVRAHAEEWKVDPKRVGILGFSAGGHLAAWAANAPGDRRTYPPVDAADRLPADPDFAVLIYPAYLVKKGSDALAPEVQATADTPPTFLAVAYDDQFADSSLAYVRELKRAKVPAELHVYGAGGHGFGMKATGTPSATWPDRMADWMKARGLLKPAG